VTGSGREETEVLGLVRQLPLLGAVSRVARRAVRRQVSQERLPDAQIEVLRTVEAHPGIGTRAVAERLQLVPNTVSTIVGDLVRAGLLRRRTPPAASCSTAFRAMSTRPRHSTGC
jgi:DNA-binding NarL/FixJ family response regulator